MNKGQWGTFPNWGRDVWDNIFTTIRSPRVFAFFQSEAEPVISNFDKEKFNFRLQGIKSSISLIFIEKKNFWLECADKRNFDLILSKI